MKINQYEFLRDGKPFEPTREEIIQFAEHELAKKDKEIAKLKKFEEFVNCLHNYYETSNLKELKSIISEEIEISNRLADIVEGQDKYISNIRHKVCNETREALLTELQLPNEEWVWHSDNYAGVSLIKEILDQIEGESDD